MASREMGGCGRICVTVMKRSMGRAGVLACLAVLTCAVPAHSRPSQGSGFPIEALGLEMLWIAPGAFSMGSLEGEIDDGDDDEPRRDVAISRGFWIGKYEVTVGEWSSFVEETGYVCDSIRRGSGIRVRVGNEWEWDKRRDWGNPGFVQTESHPVVGVSWNDAMSFANWLTEREAEAGRLPIGYEYTLPTEAEWEYACRADTTTPFCYGDALSEREGNFRDEAHWGISSVLSESIRTVAVGSYPANPWGLADMHGNVWEWCLDWYGPYDADETEDPLGPLTGEKRVKRGGSWSSSASHCRSANRNRDAIDYCHSNIGFRLCLRPASK